MNETAAEIIWFAGLIGWYLIRHPFHRRSRKTTVSRSLLDWKERSLLAVALVGIVAVPIFYVATGQPERFDRAFVPAAAWAGLPVLAAALWLFRRSHADLGKNFSATLKLRESHELVTDGVYRLIRHPMYSSFFLLGFAQFLLIANWVAGAAGLAGIGLLFACRVAREERMMIERFGEAYRSYMAGTKRIIPWLL